MRNLSKLNSQYFESFAEECFVVQSHDYLCKVSKVLTELNEVSNFEKLLIYVFPKI